MLYSFGKHLIRNHNIHIFYICKGKGILLAEFGAVGGKDPALIKRIQDAAWAEALEEVAALKKEL